MGMIKRILRQTSQKLLNKLGATQRGSHQMALNVPGAGVAQMALHHQQGGAAAIKRSRRRAKLAGSKKSAIPEVLLLASKNHLPPVQFHHVHGPNAQLSKNKFVARRTQSFCQALVFSNRVILPNERVYIKVLEIAKGWSGTIRFGFTSVDPATLLYQMPKHACPDMTNAGHTWARALADEVVRRNSVIHFSYNTNGYIHYGINNQDCGIFFANVNTSQHLWFIVDIYGLTAAVELIDPRIHQNSAGLSELDFSRTTDDDVVDGIQTLDNNNNNNNNSSNNDSRSTMYKSTGTMDNFFDINSSSSQSRSKSSNKNKKKRISRKTTTTGAVSSLSIAAAARHSSSFLYQQWPPQALLMNSSQLNNNNPYEQQQQQQQRPILPNLNSILIPTAQQNIYSPMPGLVANPNPSLVAPQRALNESHDYYQIMTNQNDNRSAYQPIRGGSRMPAAANMSLMSAAAAAGASSSALNSSSSSSSSSAATSSSSAAVGGRRGTRIAAAAAAAAAANEQEICQQLDSFQMSDNNNKNGQQQLDTAQTSNKSTTKTTLTPVAATRKRQQNLPKDKTSPMASNNSYNNANKSPTKAAKSRQSIKSSSGSKNSSSSSAATSSGSRDNNNENNKDCPICFERPINCVLYPCGHMCTCYECGVKQWKTQSKNCPICRTVIKDVIKTYMS